MDRARLVAWSEAAWMLVGCTMVCGLAAAVLALLGERQLPVAAPVVMLLGQWFFARHRLWGAGAAAALTGSAVVLALVDHLRLYLDRLLADTVATEAGAVVALVVFTGCSWLRSA
ncbi:hypothetical protein E4K10_30530 [Streptomyces sp. T1317-0309]|nr:hypothetical protein E4K10_30530 [Streptomyces sp. T1317-0309]